MNTILLTIMTEAEPGLTEPFCGPSVSCQLFVPGSCFHSRRPGRRSGDWGSL